MSTTNPLFTASPPSQPRFSPSPPRSPSPSSETSDPAEMFIVDNPLAAVQPQAQPQAPKAESVKVPRNYILELLKSFPALRQKGEGVMLASQMSAGLITTASGITTGVGALAGASAITGAAIAFPVTAGLAALGLIAGIILRQVALNQELRGNLIMIKGEAERLYNIYKVIEVIARERNLNLNTIAVQKFTTTLTYNILLAAGPETFNVIVERTLGNGSDAQALYKANSANVTTGQGIVKVAGGSVQSAVNQKKSSWGHWVYRIGTNAIIPLEVLRTIVRDITILTVFFTILQSEFDLLSREYEFNLKKNLFQGLRNDLTEFNITLSEQTLSALNLYIKDDWITSPEYTTFKTQLPKTNLANATAAAAVGATAQGTAPNPNPEIADAEVSVVNPLAALHKGGTRRRRRARATQKK